MIRHKVSREVNICAKSQGGKHDELVEIIGNILILLLLTILYYFIIIIIIIIK